MLTEQENELPSVGPGTPAGELLRRYWHPVAAACELTEEQAHEVRPPAVRGPHPLQRQERQPRSIGDHCAHRGASLLYGELRSVASPAHTTASCTSGYAHFDTAELT